jgi:hypothetical protein
MSCMRNEGAAVDFGDELAELDAQARRGEIPLAEYFARRAALLPNPVEDPATAPYSAHAAPEPTGQLGAVPNAETVPPPPPPPLPPPPPPLPPAGPGQPSYPDAEVEDDDLTMTRPPWHVQNMLAQGQLPPREQPQTQTAWAPEWHREAAPPLRWPAPGQAPTDSSFGPHVMDPSPATPAHRGRVSRNDGKRRRALVVIAVIVLAAGGAGTWLLTRDSNKGKATGNVLANSTPTQQTPQLDEQHPIVTLADTKVIADKTGKGTVTEVRGRSIMYEAEMTALADCGATTGTSQAVVAADWSFSGTLFECRDEAAANQDVRHVVGAETTTLKLRPVTVDVPKVRVFAAATNPEFASYPAQFHIRYASATQVVGAVVWAKTEQAGRAAVDQVLAQLVVNFPPN